MLVHSSEVIHQCMLHRDYTTISKSMLEEELAALAMPHLDRIYPIQFDRFRFNIHRAAVVAQRRQHRHVT